MEFTRFDHDQASDSEFEEVARFLASMDAVDRPGWSSRSATALADFLKKRQSFGYDVSLWLGSEAGDGAERLTASCWLNLALSPENRQTIVVEIRVRPDLRRRGIASDFLRTLTPMIRVAERDHVIGTTRSNGPGELWGASVGMKPTLRYVQQVLRLGDADRSLWDCPVPGGYRLEDWTDRAPDRLLASYAVALQAMDDAVSGDLQWSDPQWTPERVRQSEERLAATGNDARVVVAVDEADGEVAGLTQIAVSATRPDVVEQRDTSVRREHRGRGLGLAMKAAQLRAIADRPGLARVKTQTSDLVHMAAINCALGFRDESENVYIEADLADIEAALATAS